MYSKSTMSAIGKAKISLVNPKKMESYLIDSTILAILLRYTVWKLLSRWGCWLCKLRTFCPLEKIHRPVTEREADEDYDRSLKSRLDRCRERIHCTKNLIYIKFTLCKFDLTLTWISRNRSTKLANLGFSLYTIFGVSESTCPRILHELWSIQITAKGLLFALPAAHLLKLQRLQNAAVWLISNVPRYSHVTCTSTMFVTLASFQISYWF